MITKGYKQLLAQANVIVDTLDIDEAKVALGDNDVLFVDLRYPRELSREGKIDPEKPLPQTNSDRRQAHRPLLCKRLAIGAFGKDRCRNGFGSCEPPPGWLRCLISKSPR
jgi:hypothetical protein